MEATPLGAPAALIEGLARASEPAGVPRLGPGGARILELAAEQSAGTHFLQLGAGRGEAALRLVRALRGDEPRLTLVEPLRARGRAIQQLVRHASLGERLELLGCSVLDAIPSLYRRFDLILLLHEPEMFLADLRHAERHGRLKPGTRVVAPAERIPPLERAAYLAHVRESGLYESESQGALEVSRCVAEIEAW